MQNTSSKKSILIIIIIIVLAGLAYFYFSGTPNDSAISSLDSPNTDVSGAVADSQDVLILLNQINSLAIDTSIFENPVYKSLVDHTVIVPEQPVGRPNPFAPISGIGGSTASSTSRSSTRR